MSKRTIKIIVPFLISSLFFIFPTPVGITSQAWHLFGIFVGTILMIVLQSLPEASAIFVGVTIGCFIVTPKDILAGYMDSTVWLIVAAIMFSIGFKKSGLARRIGLILIKKIGKSSLGLAYVFGITDILLATTIPAAPARGGGIVYPLMQGVFEVVKTTPDKNPRLLGSYLTLLLYMMDIVAGSLFLTGMGPNLLSTKLAEKILGIKISWLFWVTAAIPGILAYFMIPIIVYKIHPPELRSTEEARKMAINELKIMGRVSKQEIIVGVVFVLSLFLWATTTITHIDTTLVAFLAVTIMILLNVIQWKDIAETKEAWSILIWFGGIIGLSLALEKVGFFNWLTLGLKTLLPTDTSMFVSFVIIALVAIIPHYVFPSLVGYVAAFAPVIFSYVAISGLPKYPAFFLVAFLMVISSTLTHYGNGLGPLLMATGYVTKDIWWKTGFIITMFMAIVYLTLGLGYWKLIGLW